jgi:two-component system response regulator FixJ
MLSGPSTGSVNLQLQAEAMKNQGEWSAQCVVVVDDDPAVRNSLKFSLEIEGFVVRVYGSGAELLNARDLPICGCLVVDQKMSGMTGLELIAKLRDRQISAPAILITSQPNAVLSERAARADIAIIEKPLLSNALVDRIRDACARGNNVRA